MIQLTKLNGDVFYFNSELIEYIEEVPHTVIKTVKDNTYLVKETAKEIAEEIIKYKRKIFLQEI